VSPDVFISYSREDQQQVLKLVEYLRGQGLAVWMDESDIHGATIWTKEIVEAIRACDLFILAISSHSTGSKNVVKELALASEREKIILPIYLEQCEIPETMEYQLAGIQNIALHTLDKAKAFEFVHQTIRRLGVGQPRQDENLALGQAEAASSQGGATVTGHMAPPKAKRRTSMAFGFATAIILVFGIVAYLVWPTNQPGTQPTAERNLNQIRSLVVLPFEDANATGDQQHYAGWITRNVYRRLASVDGLTVISGTSIRMLNSGKSSAEIGREFGVDAIISGTVEISGSTVELSVELIDPETGGIIWIEVFSRDRNQIQGIAEEVVQKTSVKLGLAEAIEETSEQVTKRKVSPEAMEFFQLGRFYSNRTDKEGIDKAIEYFKKAVEIEPNYASAHAWMAWCYAHQVPTTHIAPDDGFTKALAGGQRALSIDEKEPMGHHVMGMVSSAYFHNWKKAERHLFRAVELEPNDSRIRIGRCMSLAEVGRYDEALKEFEASIRIEPLNVFHLMVGSIVAIRARQFELAESKLKRSLEIDPSYTDTYPHYGDVLIQKKEYDHALDILQKGLELGAGTWKIKYEAGRRIGYIYAITGRQSEARKMAEQMDRERKQNPLIPSGHSALIYIGLGDHERAMDMIEEGYERRDWWILSLVDHFLYDSIREHPRFQALLDKLNYPPELHDYQRRMREADK
jgi:tetratricopeptide (TPR) repeat protein